jgi:hypothetical protein
MEHYHRLNREYEVKEQLGTPAAVATAIAIGKFLKWRAHIHPGQPFKIVCDQGMDEWGKLDHTVYAEWGFRLIPGIVKDTPGLQASDFAAWELQRAASDIARGTLTSWSQARPQIKKLIEQFAFGVDDDRRIPWFLVDDKRLDHLIETFSVPKRQSQALA